MKHVVLLKSRVTNQGGLEKHAGLIAKGFLDRGAKVTILTTGTPPPSEIPSFSTQTVPWPAFIRMEQFDRFVSRWLEQHSPDLVFGMDRNRHQTHIRAGNGVHAAYLKSRVLTEGWRKAFFCHFNPLHRKILQLEKAAFENPRLQKLFTNSYMVRDQILSYYDVDPKKVEVIHNGVEWKEMEADFSDWENKRQEGFRKFHLKAAQYHFLFIGNGYLRKGLGQLLTALARLKRRDVHLSVIGKDNQIDFYRARSMQLGLQNQVHFFGPSQEIRLFYQLADALVIPSFYDPFANVTVEALAMGLTVISSKHNGGYEVLTPQNGCLIDDLKQIDSITAALEEALKRPKTKERAASIRNSVEHLDFSRQMRLLMDACYG